MKNQLLLRQKLNHKILKGEIAVFFKVARNSVEFFAQLVFWDGRSKFAHNIKPRVLLIKQIIYGLLNCLVL
jgi:hypothetical protein